MPKGMGRKRGSVAYNPIDVYVGQRLRTRRTLLGLSQMTLADAIGLTFQQLQKYEKGANRITASRLYDLSQVLGVDVAYFFEDMDMGTRTASPAQASSCKDLTTPKKPTRTTNPLHKRETLELVRAYYRISDPAVRTHLRKLVDAAAASTSSDT
jgi:transcriptional regulator with XRE-family HTH domain